jgi:hypothetical protein
VIESASSEPEPEPEPETTPAPAPEPTPPPPEPEPTPPPPESEPTPEAVSYANCDEVRAAGKAPLHEGDPGYSTKLDRDKDGVACEK